MTKHPNVQVIDDMTKAVFENDRERLTELLAEDVKFHVRGALPMAGDYNGIDGYLGALGVVFEATNGDIKLEQLYVSADDHWGVEWEHAVLGFKTGTVEAKDAFIYRFENGRIAEIWMLSELTQPA